MKSLLCLVAILTFPVLAVAQTEYAYGQPSDLKGLKKVFVDTGPDMKSRNAIIEGMEKSKIGFEVMDEMADAEITLGFGASQIVRRVVTTQSGSTTSSQPVMRRAGAGVVFVKARGKDRLIYSFEDVQKSIFEGKPINNFIKEFLKLYKKAQE